MKTSSLIAALSLSLATVGTAFAQEATYEYPQDAVSQKSRAEVRAQTQQARDQGLLIVNEAQVGPSVTFVATRSRSEVHAEAQTVRADARDQYSRENLPQHGGATAPLILAGK